MSRTLADLLGVKLRANNPGLAQLRGFAQLYPAETFFDEENSQVVFGTECESMFLRTDVDEHLEPVYKTQVVTHCPAVVVFDSEWTTDMDVAIGRLQVFIKGFLNRERKTGLKTKPKSNKVNSEREQTGAIPTLGQRLSRHIIKRKG